MTLGWVLGGQRHPPPYKPFGGASADLRRNSPSFFRKLSGSHWGSPDQVLDTTCAGSRQGKHRDACSQGKTQEWESKSQHPQERFRAGQAKGNLHPRPPLATRKTKGSLQKRAAAKNESTHGYLHSNACAHVCAHTLTHSKLIQFRRPDSKRPSRYKQPSSYVRMRCVTRRQFDSCSGYLWLYSACNWPSQPATAQRIPACSVYLGSMHDLE